MQFSTTAPLVYYIAISNHYELHPSENGHAYWCRVKTVYSGVALVRLGFRAPEAPEVEPDLALRSESSIVLWGRKTRDRVAMMQSLNPETNVAKPDC